MITAKELLAKGWNRDLLGRWTNHLLVKVKYMPSTNYSYPQIITHTLAQARWAHEHIVEKGK